MSRNTSDVTVIRVTRSAGCGYIREETIACDNCGQVPMSEPGLLELNMVLSPDREEPMFLGPRCTEGEITRYLSVRNA